MIVYLFIKVDNSPRVKRIQRQKGQWNVFVIVAAYDGRIVRPSPYGDQTQNVRTARRVHELEKKFRLLGALYGYHLSYTRIYI